jgi:hypothetical protein
MIALLLLIAAPPESVAHANAVAMARIVTGARITSLGEKVTSASGEPQRRIVVRQEEGQARSLRLVEFQ